MVTPAITPSPYLGVVRSPIVNEDKTPTWALLKLFQDWDQRLTKGLNLIGDFIGNLSPTVQISGRAGNLGGILQHIDNAGVLSASALSGTVSTSRLPLALVGTPGTIQLADPAAHEWINSIDASGLPQLSQPGFADLSGVATAGQVPALSALGGSVTAAQIPPLSALTGSVTAAQVPALSALTGSVTPAQVPALSLLSGRITAGQLPAAGISGTVPLAKITPTGTDGSLTFVNGQITAVVNPT